MTVLIQKITLHWNSIDSINMRFNVRTSLLLIFCLGKWVDAATVFFPLVLTWKNTSVAGDIRPVIRSNNQFPGPELKLKEGDNVQFAVTNLCPFNVTVHFHGKTLIKNKTAIGLIYDTRN